MFFLALTAGAAPLEIVLDGTVTDGRIRNTTLATNTIVTGQPIRSTLTVDDAVIANGDGVFDYTSGSTLELEIPLLAETLTLDPTFSLLVAVFSGNGFAVNQGLYGANIGFAFAENYVVDPPVVFAGTPLFPFGAWALDGGGDGQLNTQATFTGFDSGDTYRALSIAGTDIDIAFHRIYVRDPNFYENTIDTYYGSDIIGESFGYARRPSTLDANLDALDAALTDAGCFVDLGDAYAGDIFAGDRNGEGMLGDAVALTNSGGRLFSGTIGANSVSGVQNRKGKAVAADGADFVVGRYQRTSGKRGFWYGVRVTGCTSADLEPWFGSSLAGL